LLLECSGSYANFIYTDTIYLKVPGTQLNGKVVDMTLHMDLAKGSAEPGRRITTSVSTARPWPRTPRTCSA
jgi:hypothetical protein